MRKIQFVIQATVRFAYQFVHLIYFIKQSFLKKFFFLFLFTFWIQFLFIQILSEPQALSQSNSTQQRRSASWYDRNLQTDYLSQQYLNNPLLYARHKFTLNGDEQALNTMNQFLEGRLTAPEVRRKLSGSFNFLGFEVSGSLSDSSVGAGVNLRGVTGFYLEVESENPTEAERRANQREVFIQGIRQGIYANPEEVRSQADAVVRNQRKYKGLINLILTPNRFEYVSPTVSDDGTVKYSLDGGESFETISREEVERALSLNQISKDQNILHMDLKSRDLLHLDQETLLNRQALTRSIEQHHPELKIPYQIGNFQNLTDEALASIQSGQTNLKDHFEQMSLSHQELRENINRALELNIESNIRDIANDITQGIIDTDDIIDLSNADNPIDDASSNIVEAIEFRVEMNIRTMYPSSSDRRRDFKNNRKTIQERIKKTNQDIQLKEMFLAQDPTLSRDPLSKAQETLTQQQQTLKNIETEKLRFEIARTRMAVQSVTSVLSLVGFKEAGAVNAVMQSGLTSSGHRRDYQEWFKLY